MASRDHRDERARTRLSAPQTVVLTLLLGLPALGVWQLPGVEANGAARGRCDRAGSVTEKANAYIRVFRTSRDRGRGRVLLCDRRTGRTTQIGVARVGGENRQYGGRNATALRGRSITYSVLTGVDAEGDLLPVTDVLIGRLPAGRPLMTQATARISNETDGPTIAVERIFIAPNGSVVLTACRARSDLDAWRGCDRPPGRVRVLVIPKSEIPNDRYSVVPALMVMDAGRRIDPRSLRLSPSGTHVAWDDNGKRKIARVPE